MDTLSLGVFDLFPQETVLEVFLQKKKKTIGSLIYVIPDKTKRIKIKKRLWEILRTVVTLM